MLSLPEFEYTIKHSTDLSNDIQTNLYNAGYRRMRAVYVQPSENDRTILCQGIINPTMYRNKDREDNTVYAQSSWLFRAPFVPNVNKGYLDSAGKHGGAVEYRRELLSVFGHSPYGVDDTVDTNIGEREPTGIPSYEGGALNPNERAIRKDYLDSSQGPYLHGAEVYQGVWMPYYRSSEVMGYYDEDEIYRIDNNFCTIYSPDIDLDFNGTVINTDLSNLNLFSIGTTKLTNTFGDILIETSTPPIGSSAKGFIRNAINTYGTSALISGNFYEDSIVACEEVDDAGEPKYKAVTHEDDGGQTVEDAPYLWPVYMWHRKGSLNNDVNRTGRSAELKKKVICNYRFAGHTKLNKTATLRAFHDMQSFNSTEASQICKINDNIYQGCVDTAVIPSKASDFYITGLHSTDIQITIASASGTYDITTSFEDWDAKFYDLPILKLHQDSDLYPNNVLAAYVAVSDNVITDEINKNASVYWLGVGTQLDPELGKLSSKVSGLSYFKDTVPIKYKSVPHVAVQLKAASILSEGICEWLGSGNDYATNSAHTGEISVVELRKAYNKYTLFGGTSTGAFESATWIPCGPIVDINPEADTTVEYRWGDTYFQRYECLKTYPYTPEDLNQVVEIGSFMLETRINIDGRYDRNRAQTNNLNANPQNFNLINPVYSQQDNFFNYKILPKSYYENVSFPNQITWTKSKESGADVDLWTNITMASILEMDGNLGSINKLIKFNDQLLALQDKGIAQILYNENTQISTTEGTPIEIGNSGKVQGKKYFSNVVGCSNKWSVINTARGVYFTDANDKNIYFFNGQLGNLSETHGFNTWSKKNIKAASVKWTPIDNFDNFVSYYDRLNQDVLFINKETALAFSEKVGNFTSFYDYGNTPYFCNLEDTGVWVRSDGSVWKHQAGEYCRFFGVNKPYSMTLVGNPEPQTDKIFTNLEFRASVEDEESLPFDTIEVWDEYQHGMANLQTKQGYGASKHNLSDKTASLNRKFRMWRCDIPRDNYPLDNNNRDVDNEKGIARYSRKPLDRMRNPWLYLKLEKKAAKDYIEDELPNSPLIEVYLPKTEVHDLVMTYYN